VVKSQSLQNNLYFSLTADVNVEVFSGLKKLFDFENLSFHSMSYLELE
jgi:hypothetical protein